MGWVARRRPEADGPSLADLAGLAEELGYPLRYVAGDPDARADG